MPKSKHRRKGKVRQKSSPKSAAKRVRQNKSDDLFIARSPLNDIPHEQMIDGLIKFGKKAQKDYPALKLVIEKKFYELEPLHLISSVTIFTMFGGMSNDGNISDSVGAPNFIQAHAELIQAIALRIPSNKNAKKISSPADIQFMLDEIPKIAETFSHMRYVQLESAKSDEDKKFLSLREHLRVHTQNVRNWGNYTDVLKILRELYGPIDGIYSDKLRLTATDIISAFELMVSETEKRVNVIWSHLVELKKCKTKRIMIERFLENYKFLIPPEIDLFECLLTKGVTRIQLLSRLLNFIGLTFPNVFIFKYEWLAEELQIEKNALINVFEDMSLNFGDLKEFPFDYIFLNNPIWEKPLISLDKQRVFSSLSILFFAFAHRILAVPFRNDEKLRDKLFERRSEYTEEAIGTIANAAFPGADIIRNMKWKLDGVEYETDLLIRIDSHLLIIEAKSGNIPWSALRGGLKKAKSKIQELFVEPSKQAGRLESAIQAINKGCITDLKINVPFNLQVVHRIVKLGVTLEDFATIQSNTNKFKESGIFPQDAPPIPIMNIADFKTVMEILETEAERIHYLDRRREIQESVHYAGDEIDLLAYYLKKGFSFGEFEKSQSTLILYGMSEPIDNYYQAIHHNLPAEKPKRLLTKWFNDMIESLSTRKPNRWSELAVVLLGISYSDQKKIERDFTKIKRNLKKKGSPSENIKNILIFIPPEKVNYGAAFVAFFDEERPQRHEIMDNAARLVFAKSDVHHCLVLAQDVEQTDYPYSTLAVLTR